MVIELDMQLLQIEVYCKCKIYTVFQRFSMRKYIRDVEGEKG
jgi:hypothetical protein